jgi:hypothetical protein
VIGGIGVSFWAYGAYVTDQHDKRLVAIYCGAWTPFGSNDSTTERPHCADHVSADYVREGGTAWAREATRIQDAEDDAREDACPGGPAAGGC